MAPVRGQRASSIKLILASLWLPFILTACTPPPPLVSTPALYADILALFNTAAPGYGLDAFTPTESMHHAMAYALFASAESYRARATRQRDARDNAWLAAQWLIDHPNHTDDGRIGWGLPFAWDAFQDGSVNPADTIYTITTALAIQALLDAYELFRKPALLETAIRSARAFTEDAFDRIGDELVFWYSHLPHDSYHVINVSAMLLGQLQRLSRFEPGFAQYADMAVQYILNRQQRDELGYVYWLYGGDKWPESRPNRPNDLVHEAYTIQGLVDYVRYGGTFREEIDLHELYRSLERFLRDGNVLELPNESRPARLWGVGAAVFTASLLEHELHLPPRLSDQFTEALTAAYAVTGQPFYPRQAAHVLAGLAFKYFGAR